VSSAEAVKRALLAAKSFARNEGAESGKHMLAVFDRLGIAEEMKGKTKAMPVNTGYVASWWRAARPTLRHSRCLS
jgi:molybdate transport system substrate-binding protein